VTEIFYIKFLLKFSSAQYFLSNESIGVEFSVYYLKQNNKELLKCLERTYIFPTLNSNL